MLKQISLIAIAIGIAAVLIAGTNHANGLLGNSGNTNLGALRGDLGALRGSNPGQSVIQQLINHHDLHVH